MRAARGCEGRDVESLGFSFDASLRQCPWASIDHEAWELLRWWSEWKSFQVLPWGGSDLMQQPAIVLEVLEICETQKKEAEKQQAEKQQAENKRMRKSAKHGRG